MRSWVCVLFGVFLVLATSLLTGSAGRERHARRITAVDLTSTSNISASSQNNISVCTPSTNGSCGASLQEEAKRKAKDELPKLPSYDARNVVQPAAHEVLQEHLHSDIVRHLATTPHYSSYEGPYYEDGFTVDEEPSPSQKDEHNTESVDFNSTLTTPRVELFDDRFARVSESIRQHLEELDEQRALRPTSTTADPISGSTTRKEPRSVPPTSGDLSLRNGSKVALEYTNHVSIQYNDTSDPPRSIHKDIVVENGTHVDFTSSYIHTEEFPDATPTFETLVLGRRAESNGHSNGHIPPTAIANEDGGSVLVDTATEEIGNTNIYPQSTTDSQQTTSKQISNNRVTPGEIHSTTFKPASGKSSSGSQRYNSTNEDDSVDIASDELSTVMPKLNKTRYFTRRIKLSGVPTTQPSPTEYSSTSTGGNDMRASRRRPLVKTTTETESSTLSVSSPARAGGRMFTSRRNQANATNSLAESPTMVPIASISEAPRKKPTTQYVPRRPVVSNTTRGAHDRTEVPMVRMKVSTVRPSSTTTISIKKNLVQGRLFEGRSTTDWDRSGAWQTTQPTFSNTVPLKMSNTKRHRNIVEDSAAGTTVQESTNDNSIRSKPPMLRRPLPSAAPNTEGNDIVSKNSVKPTRSRGTIKFGNSTKALNIPPTAAAWALASMRGPAESNRVVRRPADNDTDAEEAIAETITSMEAMEGLRAIEVTTISSKLPQLILESAMDAQLLKTSTPSGMSTSASMQENKIFAVHVQPPKNSSDDGAVVTSTPSEDLVSTTEPATSTTEDGTMGTTVTTVPVVTDIPTETVTSPTTTDSIPQASTTIGYSTDDGRTTTDMPEVSTSAFPVDAPEVTSTISVIVKNKGGEEVEAIATTVPTRTTTEPLVVVGDIDLGEDGDEHPTEAEEADYPGETEAPLPMEPKVVAVNISSEHTTMQPDATEQQQQTTTDVPDTTLAGETTTLEESSTPEPTWTMSSESWLPSSEEVTAYLRVTVHTTWHKLCAQKEEFRAAVAGLLSTRHGRNISAQDVILANVGSSQCTDIVSSENDAPAPIVINMYILNGAGVFDKKLNEEFPDLWAKTEYAIPLEIQQVDLMRGPLPSTSDASNAGVIAAITISCVGAVCLLMLAALLIVMRKRQKRFSYGQRCTPVSLDAYSLDSVSVYNSVRRKGVFRASKRSYGNPTFDDPGAPSHPMNFAGLANFSSDRGALEEEFGLVPQVTPKADELPEGAETKNRYSNVVPLPETRVPLALIDGEPLSDYINANYVRGPKNETNFYIACQAPMPSTVTDFWRMVWEQQSKVILMLTDLVENGVEKSSDYLPPSEVLDCHRLFGDYQITLKKREEREKYVISTLQLKNLETNTWREVTHLWYLSWPHQGVPEEANSIIAFLIEARTYMRANQGPNVVHCSPGTGRTGTILACDICIREFEQTRMVDIPRCVYRLRRDRGGAVKTRDQYVFIYQVLNTYATKLTGGGMDSI